MPESKQVNLIFPNQLFKESPLPLKSGMNYLVEEHLFFSQYAFHKLKIVFHRATMKTYENWLNKQGYNTTYIDNLSDKSDIRKFLPWMKSQNDSIEKVNFITPADDWLRKRIIKKINESGISYEEYENPLFIFSRSQVAEILGKKKKFFHNDFYISVRKENNILLEKTGEPLGGKWSFDTDNRKKYPKNKVPPAIEFPEKDKFLDEAVSYTEKYYSVNPGEIMRNTFYPINFDSAEEWLENFFKNRFREFGPYEDSIVSDESFLHHSVLSPLINNGLLEPHTVLERSIQFAQKNNIPLNSLEGFVRQIIGWREYMRGVYEQKGGYQRTHNFWNFSRKMPQAFYTCKSGIPPLDDTIKKVLKTGYNHHIERLMILGNFFLLCEIDPDEVYKWFMELYIDAYDWVMVPNVYGMSQFADGGILSTKPYISGSNYVIKMSNYGKGDWQKIWDGLFWRFINKHRVIFLKNPRMAMMVRTLDKMDEDKRNNHFQNAEEFLDQLN